MMRRLDDEILQIVYRRSRQIRLRRRMAQALAGTVAALALSLAAPTMYWQQAIQRVETADQPPTELSQDAVSPTELSQDVSGEENTGPDAVSPTELSQDVSGEENTEPDAVSPGPVVRDGSRGARGTSSDTSREDEGAVAPAGPGSASPVTITFTVLVEGSGYEKCSLKLPKGSDGIGALQAAVDQGCIRSYETSEPRYPPARSILSCIDELCNSPYDSPGLVPVMLWTVQWNGDDRAYRESGLEGYAASQGDAFVADSRAHN